MGIREFYQNKNVLLTGTTGFVGKVLLEKLLRAIPGIGTSYILIRKKEGSSPLERFKKTVLDSICFDKLKKMTPKFDEFLSKRIAIMERDMDQEDLNLSPENKQTIVDNVHVIHNCAASIDFTSPLNVTLGTNVLGPMRMLKLSREIKNLLNFVHVSTCYVNCDKKGVIEEKIYRSTIDPDTLFKDIMNTPSGELEAKTKEIIGDYPNTYTYGKALCERMLQKHHGNVPLTIVRPSIVCCSYKDPFPGWIDSISAAAAIYLAGGIGLVHVAAGKKNLIGDQVPVDYCADTIIAAGATYANTKELKIVHCATSNLNPMTWGHSLKLISPYWRTYPSKKQVGKYLYFRFENNKKILKFEQSTRRYSALMLYKFATATQNRTLQRNARLLYKGLLRVEKMSELFEYFMTNEWIYLTGSYKDLLEFSSPEEKDIFILDPRSISWKPYMIYFMWGLRRFILKENVDPPPEVSKFDALRTSGKSGISTLKWALNRGVEFDVPPKEEMKNVIMRSQKVKDVIKSIVVNKQGNMSDAQFEQILMKEAEKHCDFIFSNYNVNFLRAFAVIIHSVLRTIYDKIVVDEAKIAKLREHDIKNDGPVVIIPTHRSYLDFVLVSYIFFAFSVQCPQIVSAEDFLNMALIPHLFRGSGAFFIRRKRVEHYELYNAILYEYIQRLLITNNWLEFFIEGTRSRYGKTLAPKLGILGIVVDAYLDKKIPNAQILPVTLNYDKIVEGESYPYELLGEPKVKESLTRLVKAADTLKMNFGKVYFEIGDPIPLSQYVNQFELEQTKKDPSYKAFENRFPLVKSLGYEVVHRLNENMVVMPTAMIASILLVQRRGINEESLSEKLNG